MRFKSLKDAEAAGLPLRVDGANMTLEAVNALAYLLVTVRQANRRRDPEETFAIALDAFRRSHEIVNREWRAKALIRLGADGKGPILPSRFAKGTDRRRALAREAEEVLGVPVGADLRAVREALRESDNLRAQYVARAVEAEINV